VTVASVKGHEEETTTLAVNAHMFVRPPTDEGVPARAVGWSSLTEKSSPESWL